MPVKTSVAAALVLVLAAGLTGCSSQEEDPGTLPRLESASPSPAAPLPVPSEAMAETPQGASAFARYFFETVNRAYKARDPDIVRALSTVECGSCDAVAGDIERLRTEDHTVAGSRYLLTFAEAAPAEEQGRIIVDFAFSADPYVERDSEGSVVQDYPAQAVQEGQAMLTRVSGAWRVNAIQLVGT